MASWLNPFNLFKSAAAEEPAPAAADVSSSDSSQIDADDAPSCQWPTDDSTDAAHADASDAEAGAVAELPAAAVIGTAEWAVLQRKAAQRDVNKVAHRAFQRAVRDETKAPARNRRHADVIHASKPRVALPRSI